MWQAGGLYHLQRIIRAEQTDGAVLNRRLVRQAIWALGHASQGDTSSKQLLREGGMVTSLVGMMHARSRGTRAQARYSKFTVASAHSPSHTNLTLCIFRLDLRSASFAPRVTSSPTTSPTPTASRRSWPRKGRAENSTV